MLLLAYGRWRDTTTCLHSIFAHANEDVRVVLVDNCSPDDSLARTLAWAAGETSDEETIDPSVPLELPAIQHPIETAHYTRAQAEAGAGSHPDVALAVIENTANMGFGAGCNVGLRYILAQGDAEHVWFLNNDTVITPDTLPEMVSVLRERENVGICGSTVLHYDDPTRVQTLGGCHYYSWAGLSARLGLDGAADSLPAHSKIERRLSFVYGASMLVRRELLETVGLLTEETFLYHEEIDLARRARKHYDLAWAPKSVVYHKGGATSGSAGGVSKRSPYSTYHLVLSRIWITREHFGWATPTVWLAQLAQAVVSVLRRDTATARAITRASLGRPLESPADAR